MDSTVNKTAIVTGGYGAIGKAIARQLAGKGFRTCIAGRNESRLKNAAEELSQATGNEYIRYEVVDVSRKSDVGSFAYRWEGPLHVLVNNAAWSPRRRTETPEGIEAQFATNILGYFWMIQYFQEFMKNIPGARIVNVASYWAGGLDLDDPEFRSRRYDNDEAYRQSKQADRMLTVAFAERLKPFGITVNACHPGDVNSKLSNDLGFGGHESPDQGAATPLWVATDPELAGVTGGYFESMRKVPCRFASDRRAIRELFELCGKY